jgi:hypothetical protein
VPLDIFKDLSEGSRSEFLIAWLTGLQNAPLRIAQEIDSLQAQILEHGDEEFVTTVDGSAVDDAARAPTMRPLANWNASNCPYGSTARTQNPAGQHS